MYQRSIYFRCKEARAIIDLLIFVVMYHHSLLKAVARLKFWKKNDITAFIIRLGQGFCTICDWGFKGRGLVLLHETSFLR